MKGNVNDPKRISPYDLNGIAKLSSKPMSLTDSLLRGRRDPEELLKRISTLEAEVEALKSFVKRLIEAGEPMAGDFIDVLDVQNWYALVAECKEYGGDRK